ncbi:MAG: AAA family ATPase [Cyanobacteriota bacterium]
MFIKHLKVSNFKSFKDIDIELGDFNVVIGANASGKSNFARIFEFLKDITAKDLENAISKQGNVDYFTNINLNSNDLFKLEIAFNYLNPKSIPVHNVDNLSITLKNANNSFEIKFDKINNTYEVLNDKLIQECEIKTREDSNISLNNAHINNITFEAINSNGILKLKPFDISEDSKCYLDYITNTIENFPIAIGENNIIIEKSEFVYPLPSYSIDHKLHPFANIGIYDIDPRIAKNAKKDGVVDLESDGNNIALALDKILKDKESNRKLHNLVRSILPFAEKFELNRDNYGQLMLNLKETYFKDLLPAYLLSDGTIYLTALIIVLHFEKKPLIIIEEPERNIHPHLISKLVSLMKDASNNKQIVITTHNPEIVKYINQQNLLLVSRDKDGFSKIERPTEKETVKTFLKNDLGIDQLYINNILELH